MDKGWISIHRKIVDNPFYFSEPFTRMQAWFDMLIIANHKDSFFFKRGIKVDVKRGQIGYDLESLAKRFSWSRGKVERFLTVLETEGQITRQKTNVTTLISITNYDNYQSNDKANSMANGHQIVKQTDTNNNVNNENKNNKERDLDLFERFYELYGKKKDRKKAESAFFRLRPKEIEEIFKVLPKYIASTPD